MLSRAISLTAATVILAADTIKAYQTSPNASARNNQIDFETYEIEGEIQDMLWCGNHNEAIMIQTTKGHVYRSRDRGSSWKRLSKQMSNLGTQIVDQGQDIGKVHKMVQSPVDDSIMVFLGTTGINWITDDCGANLRALNSGKKIQTFSFHPTQRDWALATSWTSCLEFGDEPCKIYKELYLTRTLGTEWNYLTNYVFDYEWGLSKFAVEKGVKIPDERIFVTRDPDNESNQKISNKWSTTINLYESDDFFVNSRMLVEGGNTIVKTEQYMFVAKSHDDESRVNIFSSSYKSGFSYVRQVIMPPDAHLGNTFTVMDTAESQVFLFLQNHGKNTQMGNLYISDEDGHYFSLSTENVIQGSSVDFERVLSLDGTYLVNKYDSEHKHTAQSTNGRPDFRSQINEYEIIEQEEEKESMDQTRMGGTMNSKQVRTRASVAKREDFLSGKQLETNVRTYITHNKGGSWELVRSPTKTSKGKSIDCYAEDNCSLHLEIYSSMGELSPVYSTESAVGIVLGTGNLGANLTPNGHSKNLYLSRDGGLNWQSVMPGEFIYEIGDHGALLIAAKTQEPTTEVLYSWDEGKTWTPFTVFNNPVRVKNIIMEPSSTSQQFLVYGSQQVKRTSDVKQYDIEDFEQDAEAALEETVVAYIDFSLLHEPQCRGADRPGDKDSDYELWSPYDGRHGANSCYLGQQVSYVRRRQDAACYNGEDLERQTQRVPCACSDMDYECDIGYFRAGQGNSCAEETENLSSQQRADFVVARQEDQCKESGTYFVSQGYRKIPGDICTGGVDLNPFTYTCGRGGWLLGSLFTFKGILFSGVLAAILYYGWPVIEAILIVLPMPDPAEIKEKARSIFGKVSDKTGEVVAKAKSMASGDGSSSVPKADYQGNFDQMPSTLDDEDDEDGEDVGLKPTSMNYNDDEDEDEENQDMINLDSSPDLLQEKKKVKKLPKPNKK